MGLPLPGLCCTVQGDAVVPGNIVSEQKLCYLHVRAGMFYQSALGLCLLGFLQYNWSESYSQESLVMR